MGIWHRVAGFASARRTSWLTLALAVLVAGVVLPLAGTAKVSNDPAAGLSASAESSKVAALLRQFPSGAVSPALVVYARADAALGDRDLAAIRDQAGALRTLAVGGQVTPPQVSADGKAATLVVPLPAGVSSQATADQVRQVRAQVRDSLPAGVTVQVTGPAGFTADLSSVFDGANLSLLLTTVIVVAALLLLTYRSPWLWLVPLIAVGIADQIAVALVSIVSRHTALSVSDATIGIVEVVVFGAGTDYALLLIARYREELHRVADRHEAMHRALRAAGPAILASGATVALALSSLILAVLPSDRGLGLCSAIGIVCALGFGLLVLPAALVIFGRWLFWPLTPRVRPDAPAGQTAQTPVPQPSAGAWASIGRAVARRPKTVVVGSVLLLAVLSTGLVGSRYGLSQTEQFRTRAESIDGLTTLARHFPAGAVDPVAVVADAAHADQVLAASRGPGVASARLSERGGRLVRLDVVLAASPDTPESYRALRALRQRVHAVPGAGALVGGSVATTLDTRTAAARDQKIVIPVILTIVLLVLIALLRAVLGPVLLVATVVASFFASLGASSYAFRHWFGYPALDLSVPLLAFLFLVALGVDYNIFLISRGREEAIRQGTRPGIVTALAVTGGVITSAGILLAAVFAVLGVLPLITLTELGIVVGFGVLLDTLLVRTVLVPALVTILGKRFWWPGRLSRQDGEMISSC